MPQNFQVLKCYKCEVFQVHLTKKPPKWECKICGEKQSIKRHYGIGSAQECRGHVQRLNTMQGAKNDSCAKDIDSEDDDYANPAEELKQNNANTRINKKSKWSAFLDENEDIPNYNNEPEYYKEAEDVGLPKKQKRKTSPKELEKSHEYHNTIYSTKKTCYEKDKLVKQDIKKSSRESKWLAYTTENKNVIDLNKHTNYKNKDSLDLTNWDYTEKNKKEYGINCKEITEDTSTWLNGNLAEKDTSLYLGRNVSKNNENIEDFIVSDNNKPDILEQTSTWSQFLDANKPSHVKSNADNIRCQNARQYLFSLCDDTDLDEILQL